MNFSAILIRLRQGAAVALWCSVRYKNQQAERLLNVWEDFLEQMVSEE